MAMVGFQADVQHVGSTSVPGMLAKPILDVDIILPDATHQTAVCQRLEAMGYVCKGDQGVAGRLAFGQPGPHVPTSEGHLWPAHHLYLCTAGSLALKNHLVFKGALLQQPMLRSQYCQLKERLVATPGMTRQQYNREKTEFILSVLAKEGFSSEEIAIIRQTNLD